MVRSWEAEFAGCGGDEEAPLVPGERAYTNPYVDQEDLDAAMNDDNVSVLSGGDLDQEKTDATLKKSTGKGATVADAKKAAAEVLAKKPDEDDSQPWWLPVLVVVIFITFDAGKPIAERVATHGTTVNAGFLNFAIQLANICVASILCFSFMGPATALKSMFEWDKLKLYALPSSMFSISQLLNLVQNMYLDSSSRKVFSQLRIPLTAFFSTFITGSGYSLLQWLMIASLTCSVFQFQLMGSTASLFGDPKVVIGLLFSILTNIFAVLGSLLGEKNMKESKKLPFYLQKFQFDVWTALFGLFGTFFLVPAMAICIDLIQKNTTDISKFALGKEYKGNWPLVYKAAQYAYKPALTNWEYTAKYPVAGKVETLTLSNKFDTAFWSKSVDIRGSNEKVFGVAVGQEDQDNNLSSTFALLENHAKVVLKRRHVRQDAKLGELKERLNFVDEKIMKGTGTIGAHHGATYRKIGEYMMDTKFYTATPFEMTTTKADKSELTDIFQLAIGKAGAQFEELSVMRRDQPELQVATMKKNGADFESGLDAKGNVDMEAPYFTLTMSAEQAFRAGDEDVDKSVRVSYARGLKYSPAKKTLDITIARKTEIFADKIKEKAKDQIEPESPDSKETTEKFILNFVDCTALHFTDSFEAQPKGKCTLQKEGKWEASSGDGDFKTVRMGQENDFLAKNDLTKFKNDKAQVDAALKTGQEWNVQTYPGKIAAGVAVGPSTGCIREMCRPTSEQMTKNFEYLGDLGWRKMPQHKVAEGDENVFATAEYHGYTRNPLPLEFLNTMFFLAVFFNAGQGWMSAYIAKVLSSLWKNICAAIALIVIVIIEKVFMSDALTKMTVDWTRILFGTAGVLMTVLVFQMSPKEKKH